MDIAIAGSKQMDTTLAITEITRALIEAGHPTKEQLASELGVSLPALLRLAYGRTLPKPEIEVKIRSLAGELFAQGQFTIQKSFLEFSGDEPALLRDALTSTFREMREILHRSGRLSSRHEALDELGKLLFAHIMSIDNGGPGISEHLCRADGNSAKSLRDFVNSAFQEYLPTSLSHELKAEDFELRMKETEDRFAEEVIDCFEQIASPTLIAKICGTAGVDILNDTFGQFLVDSFSDEKELGQYLTPPEVVRFMVRLAFQSLNRADIDALTDPQNCAQAGLILDPSCGVGSFLSEVLRVLQPQVQVRHGIDAIKPWIDSMMGSVVVGIDKSERMIKLALTNLALFGVPTANLHLANSLLRSGSDAAVTDAITGRARLILTNPPFGAEFGAADLKRYKLATEWPSRPPKSVTSELLFIERYLEWLAPNGILAAIVPDSVLTNRGIFAELRSAIGRSARILSVTSLPAVTFGVAGTSTKTSVLHLEKMSSPAEQRHKVYFGVCGNVGFDVATRDSQRHKVNVEKGDLPAILEEISGDRVTSIGQFLEFSTSESRWDATFHAGLSPLVRQRLHQCGDSVVRVRDVAVLANDRIDPRRLAGESFQYIEISDVNGHDCSVRAKEVLLRDTPSRARKRVKVGDVLISTVRPERGTVGVVPPELDGVICSTGFAVLRCTQINPIVLARLMQSRFANAQILRNNMGIAYPAVEEGCLLDIVLPVDRMRLTTLETSASQLFTLRRESMAIEKQLREQIEQLGSEWM